MTPGEDDPNPFPGQPDFFTNVLQGFCFPIEPEPHAENVFFPLRQVFEHVIHLLM